ncbi:EF hand [Devosia sp. YR412]|uniref:hypothetical protein n=1 Tax=Devosia sp. YR412 TaxID=1881030 RepID=UPI0008AF8A52|nr:hypothetical protein [Devosia sp. YR412]SEQ25620.1 EF hand [Devosia sp. YR412]
MHKLALTLAAFGLATAAAIAQTPTTFADVDTDASGELSFAELQVVWPDLSQAEFDAADADGSGGLSVEELNSVQPPAAAAPAAPAAPLDPAAVPAPQ